MKDFRSLNVWRKAHQLTLAIYKITNKFPAEERYSLTSQCRRAASSVAAMLIWPDSRRSPCAQQASWNTIFCWPAIWITFSELEHDVLNSDTIEVKRMLASFLQRLRAERQDLGAER